MVSHIYSRFIKYNKILFNVLNLNLFIIALLIIVIIPLNFSRNALSAYNLELFISLLSIAFILGGVLIVFSYLISIISLKFDIYSIFSSLVSFLLIWIFITGIFFPVTGGSGPFLNLSLPIEKKYEIILIGILIILFYFILKKKDKKNYFFRFIYFFVLTNFIFLYINVQKDNNENYKNNLNDFGKKNLIVLSFDGISDNKLYNAIINDENFNRTLKDFKFYKNTVSGAPFTSPSINIEINGKFIKKKSKNFYKNILNKEGLNTSVYGSYHDVVSDKNKTTKEGELQGYNINYKLNNFFQSYGIGSIGRWATPMGIFLTEPLIYKEYYKNFINLVSRNDNNKLNPFDTVNTKYLINLYEYDEIFDNITLNKNLNDVIRMYHFTFSHWPVSINENCEEVGPLDAANSFEHEQIALKCISKKIIKFINNLKTKKIYNNSMIIIKSDHGKPNYIERFYTDKMVDLLKKKKFNKYYKDYPYSQKINNNFFWGFGRYKPFILIKEQNQTKNKIEISDKQVFLHDLSATYCNFFLKTKECNDFDKNNLLKDENQFSINNYDIYIPKKEQKYSSTKLSNLKKYQISNDLNFLEFLKLNKMNSSE